MYVIPLISVACQFVKLPFVINPVVAGDRLIYPCLRIYQSPFNTNGIIFEYVKKQMSARPLAVCFSNSAAAIIIDLVT